MNPVISAHAFGLLLKDGPFVIDVRRPDEFAEGHVEGARLFPLDELAPATVAAFRAEGNETIYILCKSGMRLIADAGLDGNQIFAARDTLGRCIGRQQPALCIIKTRLRNSLRS